MQSLPILLQQSPLFLIGPEYPLDIFSRAVIIEVKQPFTMLYKIEHPL